MARQLSAETMNGKQKPAGMLEYFPEWGVISDIVVDL